MVKPIIRPDREGYAHYVASFRAPLILKQICQRVTLLCRRFPDHMNMTKHLQALTHNSLRHEHNITAAFLSAGALKRICYLCFLRRIKP